jgi:hypothetical protein
MKASDRQEGGQHYKDFPIQPAEFCQRNRLNWCEANVVKYVCRHASKKGAEDLLKAKHYIDLLLEWEYPQPEISKAPDPLCYSCRRLNTECHGAKPEYPATSDGGCEGYIKAEGLTPLCKSCGVKDCEAADPWRNICSLYVPNEPSLCDSCAVACEVHGIVAANGSCNRYVSALRERMMEAKEEAANTLTPKHPLDCVTSACEYHKLASLRNCDKYPASAVSMCNNYEPIDPFAPTAKQEPPTAAVTTAPHSDPAVNCKDCVSGACIGAGIGISSVMYHGCEQFKPAPVALEICPSCNEHPGCKGTVAPEADGRCKGFSAKEAMGLPSIALDCSANAAWLKYLEECREVEKAGTVLHSLIELWDCIQAVQTCIEKGGDKQDVYNGLIADMEQRRLHCNQVDLARRAMLMKNAARWRYSDEVNRIIIESNGHRFTPKEADA